jgi:hypothetical protein
MAHCFYLLADAGLSQSSAAPLLASVSLAYAFACIAGVLLITSLLAFAWVRRLRRQLSALQKSLAQATDGRQKCLEDCDGLRKDLDEKRRLEQELRRDLAAQKKKNFTAQEEIRSLIAKIDDQRRERDTLLAQKPAFSMPPETPSDKANENAARLGQGQTSSRAAMRPRTVQGKDEPEGKPSPHDAALAAERVALERRILALDLELKEARKQLDAERKRAQAERVELDNLRDLAEKLRRIDILSKNRIELLEDKLGVALRAHYDAVSELAALKGDVVPPPPLD